MSGNVDTPLETVHAALAKADCQEYPGEKWDCPVCGKDKQLSVSMTDDGKKVMLHCFRGCDTEGILDTVGLKFSDLHAFASLDDIFDDTMFQHALGKSYDMSREQYDAYNDALQKRVFQLEVNDRAAELYANRKRDHGTVDSWLPLDPSEWLNGDEREDVPTIGARDDGVCLFYPGKTHSLIGATETGKSWLALYCCAQEISAGNDVLYIDFEDSLAGVYSRLVDMVDDNSALKHFQYVRPATPVGEGKLDRYSGCSLAIIDGITEGMNMHGLNPIDNLDVAKFNGMLPNPLAALGASVVSIDHVVKDSKSAGKYPIGAVHKLNAISGASYMVQNVEPFGVGQTGWSTVSVSKDRPGRVREHCLKDKNESYIASLFIRSAGRKDAPKVSLEVPAGKSFQPTVLMEQISDAVIKGCGPYGKSELRGLVKGKATYKDQAIDELLDGGYLVNQGTASKWAVVSVKPYERGNAKAGQGAAF